MALAGDPPPSLASSHGSGSGLAMAVARDRPPNLPPPPPRRHCHPPCRMRLTNARGAGKVPALERVDVRLLRLPAVAIRPTSPAPGSEQMPKMEPKNTGDGGGDGTAAPAVAVQPSTIVNYSRSGAQSQPGGGGRRQWSSSASPPPPFVQCPQRVPALRRSS